MPKTNEIDPKYSLYYLSLASQSFKSHSRGTTISGITKKQLKELQIPLPPLSEQKRIVAQIESLFTQLDAGVAGLKRAQAALKRYRASVLKAAVEGRLVPQDPNDEPASELLRPNKIIPLSNENLPELPDTWCWATIKSLVANELNSFTDGPFGSKLKTAHYRGCGTAGYSITKYWGWRI